MLQQHRMIHLLLAIALITGCKGQYGEIAPPAPIPPLNYASNDPDNIPHTSQPSYSTNEYENLTKQIIQSQNQLSSVQLSDLVENVTCGLLAEGNLVLSMNLIPSVIRQSTIRQKILTSAGSPSSKFSPVRQRITASLLSSPSTTTTLSSKSQSSQSFSTRSSSLKNMRQRTRQPIHLNVTTKHRQIISTSKKPISVVTQQSEITHSTQLVSRITQNHMRETSRSTRLPSTIPVQPDSTKRPENRPISSLSRRLDCSLAPFDTLFVVDSTSSVRQFFEDHRTYIIEIINLILPEFDNDTRIGIIEYSSSLRRQVKLRFIAHKNRTEIVETVKKLPFFAGITATGAALKLALEILQDRRSNVLTNVVVLTDGFSYDLVDEPSSMLHRLPNVRTFTATVTDSWRQYELETIAGEGTRVFKGKNSTRDLAKALTSCDDGSRHTGIQRNNLLR
ncbi:von Willebrand factor type A domain family protein [Brugia pahangi]